MILSKIQTNNSDFKRCVQEWIGDASEDALMGSESQKYFQDWC